MKADNLASIGTILENRIDTRRRKIQLTDFCAYRLASSNGKYAVLNIWDEVGGNHVSSSWVLVSSSQVVDTKLNSYAMKDTAKTKILIANSVKELSGIDNQSANELTSTLIQAMRYHAKNN